MDRVPFLPTFPSKWNTLDEVSTFHARTPLFLFPRSFPNSMRIDQENREERKREKGGGGCDQWNSVSANLCRWNVETDRSGKVENNRSSVKPRTRPHPSRVIPLKTFPSTRRSAEGWWWVDALGRDVKAFVRFEFLRRVRRWMLTSSARIFLSFREGETESFEDDGNFLRAWRTIEKIVQNYDDYFIIVLFFFLTS